MLTGIERSNIPAMSRKQDPVGKRVNLLGFEQSTARSSIGSCSRSEDIFPVPVLASKIALGPSATSLQSQTMPKHYRTGSLSAASELSKDGQVWAKWRRHARSLYNR